MKRSILLCGFAAAAVSGCQFIPGTAANEKRQSQAQIAAMLNDPSSALFRNLDARTFDGDHGKSRIVCGEVNGKNAFGAYAGYRRFFFEPKANDGMIDPATSVTQADVNMESRICGYDVKLDDCPRAKAAVDAMANQAGFDGVWDQSCKAS